jgi:hypothetical protein
MFTVGFGFGTFYVRKEYAAKMATELASQSRNVVAELAYHFRVMDQAPPVLLLGAGASYRSGIPLAAEAVKRIAKASFAWTRLGLDEKLCNPAPSDWMPYLERHDWFIREPDRFAENFPAAVKHLLTPKERRRRFLRDLVVAPNGVSEGYKALSQMMLRRLCWTVLTTNFDCLMAEALRQLGPNVREIVEVNRTLDDLVRFSLFREFQIVYLHGAVEFYRDRNEEEETKRLDDELVRRLRPMLRDAPLIVIGYRGYELSVMQHLLGDGLSECQKYPNGIFWCRRRGSTLHENVQNLRNAIGGNFHDLEIDGFDELMVSLEKALAGCSRLPYGGTVKQQAGSPSASDAEEKATGLSKESLDIALVLSTMGQYFGRLRLGKFDSEKLDATLLELGIIQNIRGKLAPTFEGYLLFGRDVPTRFPSTRVIVTLGGKQRLVVEGNLITQLEALTGFLNSPEVNPVLRIKGQSSSFEDTAYPPLALREVCVNLLVHRDYQMAEASSVEFLPGRHLVFTNPGGLLSDVADQLQFEATGRFTPKRGLTAIRNPVLADVFYGLGKMDKAGSGLADILKFMVQQGGGSEFSTAVGNTKVVVTLKQASQEKPADSTATPLSRSEVFVTNLLPFLVMPKYMTAIPLKHRRGSQLKLPGEIRQQLPQFVYHSDHVVSFAAPELFEKYPAGELLLDRAEVEPLEEIFEDEDRRRILVWLLHQHWANFLWTFKEETLTVESRQKRAYFQHRAPYRTEVSYVAYTSRMGRKIKRGVVKRRGGLDKIWHENEGLHYSAISVDDQWALQLKPIYVFTGPDGATPLPPHAQTRRATRRFKFDRNKSVEDDLTFWSRFLSKAGPVINIGGSGIDDLILSANYCQAEMPEPLMTEVE